LCRALHRHSNTGCPDTHSVSLSDPNRNIERIVFPRDPRPKAGAPGAPASRLAGQ